MPGFPCRELRPGACVLRCAQRTGSVTVARWREAARRPHARRGRGRGRGSRRHLPVLTFQGKVASRLTADTAKGLADWPASASCPTGTARRQHSTIGFGRSVAAAPESHCVVPRRLARPQALREQPRVGMTTSAMMSITVPCRTQVMQVASIPCSLLAQLAGADHPACTERGSDGRPTGTFCRHDPCFQRSGHISDQVLTLLQLRPV